jgi:hypothetical protein
MLRLLDVRTVNVDPYIQKIVRDKKKSISTLTYRRLLEIRTVNVYPYT